jgi:hypothetical protein
MWGEHRIHQNNTRMDYGSSGDRWAEHPKKANLPYDRLSVQMQDYVIMNLIDGYYNTIMAPECLDLEKEG